MDYKFLDCKGINMNLNTIICILFLKNLIEQNVPL